jgi:hypothetical protein
VWEERLWLVRRIGHIEILDSTLSVLDRLATGPRNDQYAHAEVRQCEECDEMAAVSHAKHGMVSKALSRFDDFAPGGPRRLGIT